MSRSYLAGIAFVLGVLMFSAEPTLAQQPGCYIVWADAPSIQNDGPPRNARRRRLDFSAASILEVDFYVLLPAGSQRNVDLSIYTPKGHLYQTLSIPASHMTVGGERSRHRRRSRFAWASAKLPVAGTTIVNNSLYGKWTAVPNVRGDSSPCAQPRAFYLNP